MLAGGSPPLSVDWSEFDGLSEMLCECVCGGPPFSSHAKVVRVRRGRGGRGPLITYSRKPCPSCGQTEGHLHRISGSEQASLARHSVEGPRRNARMEQKLRQGKVVDVNAIGAPAGDEPGLFILRTADFEDGVDYCDFKNREWIRSIGRNKYSGAIYASTDTRFYQNDDWECIWLR